MRLNPFSRIFAALNSEANTIMEVLAHFTLPLHGISTGTHRFEMDIDGSFFKAFEESLIEKGALKAVVDIDKRPDMYVMDIEVIGTVDSQCDRCTNEIQMPIEGRQQWMIKFAEEVSETDEIIFILPGTGTLNISRWVYEAISLSLPMIINCAEAGEECDSEALKYLDDYRVEEQSEQPGIWDALKNFNTNDSKSDDLPK